MKEFLSKEEFSLLSKNVEIHDNSKYQDDEFYSYAEHFFGGKNRSNNSFEQAKSLHKSRNPHHPEYWKNNNKEMPKVYIVEMVLNWWSFSISKDKPKEIFNFYEKHKDELKLTQNETKTVEQVLSFIEQIEDSNCQNPDEVIK